MGQGEVVTHTRSIMGAYCVSEIAIEAAISRYTNMFSVFVLSGFELNQAQEFPLKAICNFLTDNSV